MVLILICFGLEWRYFIRVVCCVLGGFLGILERNMCFVILIYLVILDVFCNGLMLRNLWIYFWNDVIIIFIIFCESFFVECIVKLNLGWYFFNIEIFVGLYCIVCNMMCVLMYLECYFYIILGLRRMFFLWKSIFGRFNILNWFYR